MRPETHIKTHIKNRWESRHGLNQHLRSPRVPKQNQQFDGSLHKDILVYYLFKNCFRAFSLLTYCTCTIGFITDVFFKIISRTIDRSVRPTGCILLITFTVSFAILPSRMLDAEVTKSPK